MESVESLDKVHGYSGQSPGSPLRLDPRTQYSVDIVHCFPGQCPWTSWTMSMDLVESLDNVHGYSGQIPESPFRLDNVHGLSGHDMSTVSLEIVHGLPGQCPWTTGMWKVWTMSSESMGSLDIVHGQSPLFFLTELIKKT